MAVPLRSTLKLVLRQHRFALVVLGIAAVALAIDWVFVAWIHFGPPHDCTAIQNRTDLTEAQASAYILEHCEPLQFWLAVGTNFVLLSANFLPLFAVLIAAAPLVAAEVEFGTATLAWTLARSRRAWLLPRMAFLLLAVLLIGLLAGLVADALTGELYLRGQSPWASLYAYTGRGALITSRVLLIGAAGLFGGALMGRQMPGLLLGGVIALGLTLGITIWDDHTNRENAVPIVPPQTSSLTFESRLKDLATGQYLDWWNMPADAQDPSVPGWDEKYAYVDFGIPDTEAGAVLGRNVLAYGLPTLLMLGLTMVVVERRRPYLS